MRQRVPITERWLGAREQVAPINHCTAGADRGAEVAALFGRAVWTGATSQRNGRLSRDSIEREMSARLAGWGTPSK